MKRWGERHLRWKALRWWGVGGEAGDLSVPPTSRSLGLFLYLPVFKWGNVISSVFERVH